MAQTSAPNPFKLVPAPVGMDSTSDPAHLAPGKCVRLQNYLTNRPGYLQASVTSSPALGLSLLASADGIGAWYAYPAQNGFTGASCASGEPNTDTSISRLLCVSDGFLYYSAQTPAGNPPYIDHMIQTGTQTFFVGQTCRFMQFIGDTIIVQEGGGVPQRITFTNNIPGFYQLGMCPPSAIPSTAITVAAGPVTATRYYAATYVDEKGRESSLGNPVGPYNLAAKQVTFTNWTGAGFPGIQQQQVNIYGTTTGDTSTYYLVGTLGNVNGVMVTSVVDNFSDNVLNGAQVAPNPGQNDVPNAASLVSTYFGRVVMDDSTNVGTIQISNLNSATQWASIPTVATDGMRLEVSASQGDPITALLPFGDELGIWRRKGFYLLYGTDFTNFAIRHINDKGCIAPDSCVNCGGPILYLADDGVYVADVVPKNISYPDIDRALRNTSESAKVIAKAAYIDRCYRLNIGNLTYVYSFNTNAWTTERL